MLIVLFKNKLAFISDSLSETDCINYFSTWFCELMQCFLIGRSRQGYRMQKERKRKRIEICNGRCAILRFSLLQLVTPHLIRYPRIALLERRNKYLITKLVPFLVSLRFRLCFYIVFERLSNALKCRKHSGYWMLKRFAIRAVSQ